MFILYVVSVPPHAVPADVVSRDIVLNQFSNQHGVCSLTILHLATRMADYKKKTRSSEEKVSVING